MVAGFEVVLLLVVLAFFIGAATIVKTVKPFIVNAVVGLLTIWIAQSIFAFSVGVTPIALVIVAVGGFPGALLILLLALFGVGFVP